MTLSLSPSVAIRGGRSARLPADRAAHEPERAGRLMTGHTRPGRDRLPADLTDDDLPEVAA